MHNQLVINIKAFIHKWNEHDGITESNRAIEKSGAIRVRDFKKNTLNIGKLVL